MVNCHPFDAERSAGRTYLQGCHKSSPSPKDGAPKGLERPGSGHVQGTHFYPKSNFRQATVVPSMICTSAPGGVAAPKILPRDFLYCSRSVDIKELSFV